MQVPSHENHRLGRPSAGFDVHGDLVAAVADDRRILIWNVKNGFVLRKTDPSTTLTGNVTCVRFVSGENDGKGLRLMVAAGSAITTFE